MSDRLGLKHGIVCGISLLAIVFICSMDLIAQSSDYHEFADTRTILQVPNFWNVISNLPFLMIGLSGMFCFFKPVKHQGKDDLSVNRLVFFIGIFLTGIGSSYYHLHPDNASLLWDRLPMTIAFTAFFSLVLGEFISVRAGQRSLFPLVLLGIIALVYWRMTAERGMEDLRFYVLIQFLPVLLIPIILLLYKANRNLKHYFWLVLLSYGVAKLFETFDDSVYVKVTWISGHSLKHMFAALGPGIFLWMHRDKISQRGIYKN